MFSFDFSFWPFCLEAEKLNVNDRKIIDLVKILVYELWFWVLVRLNFAFFFKLINGDLCVGVCVRRRILIKGNGEWMPGQVWLSEKSQLGELCMCLTLINRYIKSKRSWLLLLYDFGGLCFAWLAVCGTDVFVYLEHRSLKNSLQLCLSIVDR